MRNVAQEFCDLRITAKSIVNQVPSQFKPQVQYYDIFRGAIDEAELWKQMAIESRTKFLHKPNVAPSAPSWNETTMKKFLLRPFLAKDRTLPDNMRKHNQTAKGLVRFNKLSKTMWYNMYGKYNFADKRSNPIQVIHLELVAPCASSA